MKAKNLLLISLCQVLLCFGCSSDVFTDAVSNEAVSSRSTTLAGEWVQLTCGDANGNVFVHGMQPGVCSADVSLSGKTLQVSNLRGEVIIGPFYARASSATEWLRMDDIDLGGMGRVNCRITFDPTKNQNDYLMGNPYKGNEMKFYINIEQGMTRSFKMRLHYDITPDIADEFTVRIN